MVLVLMVSFCSLAFANLGVENKVEVYELKMKYNGLTAVGNDTDNDTDDPDGNESEIDLTAESEIEIMNNTLGAEIRLLQLEKAILKNLLKGERVIAVLQAMGYNTTELEGILDEMRLLLEEVQTANASDNDSVQQFIDLKSDAKKLTTEFRDAIRDLLGDIKIKELKEQLKEMVGDELQNYTKRIQNKIKQFNRNQIHKLYGLIGVTNESLAEAYKNGTVSTEEVKAQINKMVNMMIKEKRNQLFSELKKENINNQAFADEEGENAMLNFNERQQNRENNRSEKANNQGGNGKGKGHQNGQ